MAEVNNEFICCVKCNGQFDKVDKVPITLSCLHSFCRPCLKQTVDPDHKLNCPVCRKILTIEGDIDDLPADVRLLKMIDLISNNIKETCLQHKSHLYFFCTNCKTPICHDCTLLKHPKEQKHAIIDISEAFENYAPKFEKLDQFSQRVVDAMKVMIIKYKDELKELERMHRVLKEDISEKFEYYRAVLNQREKYIKKRASTVVKEQREVIENACMVIEDKLKSLNILQEQFKIIRLNNDTRLVFKVFHEFKDRETFFTSVVQPEGKDFFKKYIFTHTIEEPLLDLLKDAGQIELVKNNRLKFSRRHYRTFNPEVANMRPVGHMQPTRSRVVARRPLLHQIENEDLTWHQLVKTLHKRREESKKNQEVFKTVGL